MLNLTTTFTGEKKTFRDLSKEYAIEWMRVSPQGEEGGWDYAATEGEAQEIATTRTRFGGIPSTALVWYKGRNIFIAQIRSVGLVTYAPQEGK